MDTANNIPTYQDRINAIRSELKAEIVGTMRAQGLSELSISDHEIYVVWFNGDNEGYDSVVVSVHLTESDEIELSVMSDDDGIVHLDHYEFGCKHVEWLNDIMKAVKATLSPKTE